MEQSEANEAPTIIIVKSVTTTVKASSSGVESIRIDDTESMRETAIQSVDLNVPTCSRLQSYSSSGLPLIIITKPESPIITQPLQINSRLLFNEPQTLFQLALLKLKESSISLAFVNHVLRTAELESSAAKPPELSPPDSLTNAPPSYSFVLRQTAAQRRPRLMGTFIPSPSFVQHTPPPNYAAAFDIYVGNQIPQPTARVYSFGFTPMPVVCPECGYTGITSITSKITLCTHVCALILCIFCCWLCAPLPYIMRSCKDVYHYCRNCRNFLGMYSPSNPETPYHIS